MPPWRPAPALHLHGACSASAAACAFQAGPFRAVGSGAGPGGYPAGPDSRSSQGFRSVIIGRQRRRVARTAQPPVAGDRYSEGGTTMPGQNHRVRHAAVLLAASSICLTAHAQSSISVLSIPGNAGSCPADRASSAYTNRWGSCPAGRAAASASALSRSAVGRSPCGLRLASGCLEMVAHCSVRALRRLFRAIISKHSFGRSKPALSVSVCCLRMRSVVSVERKRLMRRPMAVCWSAACI